MNESSPRTALRARWVFPVEGPPISDGTVIYQGERLLAVGPRQADSSASIHVDLGNVAVLPGLINAHTHLEFSGLAAPLGHPGIPFPDWIRRVVESRRNSPPSAEQWGDKWIEQGLRQSLAAGVTALGEISSGNFNPAVFEQSGLAAVVFLELIGLREQRIEPNLARAESHLAAGKTAVAWQAGLSPHAPYTVHPRLLSRGVDRSAAALVPVCFHLAESREELELLQTGTGAFVSLLRDLDAWNAAAIPRGTRPLDYLKVLIRAPRALVVHGNYLDDEEIAFLAANSDRLTLVYCPRTHDYFGHSRHPLYKVLAVGGAAALGTDGRGSNPDLDLLAEMRFTASAFPDIPLSTVLELGTACGARALGWEEAAGSLRPGKLANLTIVSLAEEPVRDPHELLFHSPVSVCAVLSRGKWVHGEELIRRL